MQRLINQLIPFVLIGFVLVAFAFGIFLLAYLLLFGAIVGFILFGISWIRAKFFASKQLKPTRRPRKGRTFDSNDWREL